MVAFESADTAVDTSPHDTAVRAIAWTAPPLHTALTADTPPPWASVQWSTWATHDTWVEVQATVTTDDHPADTANGAARTVLVTATPIGRDGWHGAVEQHVDAVVLTSTPTGWRLAAITAQ